MHAGRTPELVLAMVDDAACRCTGHRRGVHIECLKFSHNYIASVEAAKKVGQFVAAVLAKQSAVAA